jgi:hypothetical protein
MIKNMLNYILIGLGIVFLILSIMVTGSGLSPEEGTSTAGEIGYFIGSLIVAIPMFIISMVLLAVGLLRKSKEKKTKEIKFGCKCCRCSNCSLEHNHWTHD